MLTPDSTTSKVFSRWKGPGVVREIKSKNSYMVELDGVRRHIHADKLRKYNVQVDEVCCDIAECSTVTAAAAATAAIVGHCAIVHDEDEDFGDIREINPTSKVTDSSLPSQKIDRAKIAHLSEQQQEELLNLLDQFSECFADRPGFCDFMQHEIHVGEDFRPKRLRAYRVPENLKPAVRKEIQQMLDLAIIKPSKSEMASPIVCVLKGKAGQDGVRIAVDYRYLNKHCEGDAYPLPNVDDCKDVTTPVHIFGFIHVKT